LLERYPEALVEFKWYDRFRELIEVSSENIGSIMHTVACPQQALAILVWCVEDCDKLFNSALSACETEDTLNIGCCVL